ncbi:sugar-1-phosphate guanyl transferase, putative [Perkinsus marinus ATCC 50983]|uniref:Translation initiation factor eIF2B subunit gamma n=1 Tax=Perkinsus marinus (strain ATCC 50983 / TXsc) TaxID=423536 RepID=C5LIE7_PERM5|nr:sugar-1-phosphate guanyl transferase, putative [Perkinsus marinus ATCC 50983]EER03350.1 sugar-1-phosphate guanyl transferase, putative [Perkinsus marinus ATCC 50983]|eukprot:XP_002771534.1 sugar-1-phosphate guanyl transferase, putative [Perkinsus marinus ATCC 50983]
MVELPPVGVLLCGGVSMDSSDPSLADIGIPKPLLSVANKPLYSYAVQALTASPLVSRVVLIGWTEHADALRSSVSEYKDLFNGVEVSVEGVPAEASAAEALMLVLERQADLKGKSLLVGYGDYMGAWPVRSTQSAAEVEVSMARVKDVPEDFVYTAYGTVEKTIVVLKSAEAVAFDGSLSLGLSKVFAEGDVTLVRNLVDTGCYYMGGNALERLREFMADEDEVDRNLRDGFVPWMVDKGYRVLLNGPSESPSVDPCKSRVKGTESLLHFNQQKLKHDRSTVKGVLYGSSSTVEEGTVVKNTVLGNSVRIADKCRVTKSVVMDGVEIDSGSTVQECVLAEGCEIGSNVKLSKCTVAKGVKVLKSGEYEEEDFDHDDIRFTNTHGVASCGQWWWRDKGHVSEASSNAVILAVMRERLEKSLRDKEKMRQRMELLEDELALCKVKKRSYRADGKRLKAEVDTLRARAACLGEESSSNVEEVRYWQKTAKEANKHLTEMSKSYSHEVRLLQKAVECARGNSGGKQQLKPSETADLVERLSRAVLQRDESFREKIRLGTKVREFRQQVSALQRDRNLLSMKLNAATRQMKTLKESNKLLMGGSLLAQRGTVVMVKEKDRREPASTVTSETPVLGDDDFEVELRGFEQRYMMLAEGSDGAEQLASRVQGECRELRREAMRCREEADSLRGDLMQWKDLAEERLVGVAELRGQGGSRATGDERGLSSSVGDGAEKEDIFGEAEKGMSSNSDGERAMPSGVDELEDAEEQEERAAIDEGLVEEGYECMTLYKEIQQVNTGQTMEIAVLEKRLNDVLVAYEVVGVVDGVAYTMTVNPRCYQGCEPDDMTWISEVVTLVGLVEDEGGRGQKRLVVPEPAASTERGNVNITLYQYTPTLYYITAYDSELGTVGSRTVDLTGVEEFRGILWASEKGGGIGGGGPRQVTGGIGGGGGGGGGGPAGAYLGLGGAPRTTLLAMGLSSEDFKQGRGRDTARVDQPGDILRQNDSTSHEELPKGLVFNAPMHGRCEVNSGTPNFS